MCATVFGASSGKVSMENVPFDVSTTITGAAPCATMPTMKRTTAENAAHAENDDLRESGGFRVLVDIIASRGSRRPARTRRGSHKYRTSGKAAGRRSGPRTPDTG